MDRQTDSAVPRTNQSRVPTTSTCPSRRHLRKDVGQGRLLPLVAPKRGWRLSLCSPAALANSGQDPEMARSMEPSDAWGDKTPWSTLVSETHPGMRHQWVEQHHGPVALSQARRSSSNPGQRLCRTNPTRTRFTAAPTPAPQQLIQLPGAHFCSTVKPAVPCTR